MFKVTYYENAHFVKLSAHSQGSCNPGARGVINSFSRRARLRLITKIAKIDTSKIYGKPFFITLTYPASYSKCGRDWKNDLANYIKRFNRRFKGYALIWRLEFQKRGAPHFHIIAFNSTNTNTHFSVYTMRRFTALNWYQIVDSGDIRHFKAGTNVEQLNNWRAVTSYVSKYMGKVEQSLINGRDYKHIGRYWGIYNRKYLPIVKHEFELTFESFHLACRVAQKIASHYAGRKIPLYGTFLGTYLLASPKNILSMLTFIAYDSNTGKKIDDGFKYNLPDKPPGFDSYVYAHSRGAAAPQLRRKYWDSARDDLPLFGYDPNKLDPKYKGE